MKKIEVKTKKQLEEKTMEYRMNGYNIVTFGKTLREMENDNEMIVIEVVR